MRTVIVENTWTNFTNHGWGNGYVLIPKSHPMHGKHYDDIDVSVHGGLTFGELVDAELISRFDDLKPEDEGSWMVGFDTCHCGDNESNWPKEAVQAEADRLMAQLAAIKPEAPTATPEAIAATNARVQSTLKAWSKLK